MHAHGGTGHALLGRVDAVPSLTRPGFLAARIRPPLPPKIAQVPTSPSCCRPVTSRGAVPGAAWAMSWATCSAPGVRHTCRMGGVVAHARSSTVLEHVAPVLAVHATTPAFVRRAEMSDGGPPAPRDADQPPFVRQADSSPSVPPPQCRAPHAHAQILPSPQSWSAPASATSWAMRWIKCRP